MLLSLTPLLSFLLLLECCVYSQGSPLVDDSVVSQESKYEKSAYEKLEDHLSKERSRNDNPETIITKAQEWLNADLKSETDTSLTNAVKSFTSLSQVLVGDKCSKKNLDILLANDLDTEGRSRAVDEMNQTKPPSKLQVDKVVSYYATEHAKACQDEYVSRYRTRYPQLDQEQLKRVKVLLDQVIVMSYYHKSRIYGVKRLDKLYNEIIMHRNPVRGVESARAYYIVLGDLTDDHPEESQYLTRVLDRVNGGKVVHGDKIEELFTKYLVEPCQYYVKEFGDIFAPARFEANWYHEIKEVEHDYYYAWARYRFCESFLGVNHEPLIQGMVNLARLS